MRITAFNPQIVTKNAEPVMELFEHWASENAIHKEEIGKLNITDYRMKDANGFYIDVSRADVGQPRDTVTIRLNVDNFDARICK